MAKKLLICGGAGLLGPYIEETFSDKGYEVLVVSRNTPKSCDFTNPEQIAALVDEFKPDVAVHLIALTSVEECENAPEKAELINVQTVKNLAGTLSDTSKLVYISSDQVYGDVKGPHVEENEAPVNVYGETKFAGEHAALTRPDALVLRTNLFGPSRTEGRYSLSDFFVSSFEQGEEIIMFEDVYFSPLHMATLAETIEKALAQDISGVYNLGSREGMSKAEFGLEIAAHLGMDASKAKKGKSAHVEGRAYRAKDLRMDVSKIEHVLGEYMPTLKEEISKL